MGGHLPDGCQVLVEGYSYMRPVRPVRLSHCLLVLAHREDCESYGFMRIVHCLERTHLLPAGSAPRGPKVDDYWTTPVVAQGNRDAIGIVGDKVWCWLPRHQRAPGLLRP